METETIDRLFLELSQVTRATTSKELALQALVDQLRAENARLREAMPSERVLLMFATAIPHHPLFSQAMREECTDAIMRLSKAKKENVGDR